MSDVAYILIEAAAEVERGSGSEEKSKARRLAPMRKQRASRRATAAMRVMRCVRREQKEQRGGEAEQVPRAAPWRGGAGRRAHRNICTHYCSRG